MIPKYPYIVTVDYKLGDGKTYRKAKSFETLTAAVSYHCSIQRKLDVKKSTLSMILDEDSRCSD